MPVFRIATGLLWLFVVLRFLLPLPWHPVATVMVAVVLLMGSQHHFLSRYITGSPFSPETPRTLGIVANVLFGTVVLLATFQAALDLLLLAGMLLKGSYLVPPAAVRYMIGASALAFSVYGVGQAIRVPPVKEIEVFLPDLGPELEGYRLIQLTDLHLSRLFPARWARDVVAKTNAQKPDLIVFTGDLLDGTLHSRREDIQPLSGLRARDGVFVATGNHEYYYGFEGWMRRYQELGMTPLANSHVVLSRGRSSLVLAGITDMASLRFGLAEPDLGRALLGAPSGAPKVLLAHQPKTALLAARAGVDLQLSGHTHGGMVVGLDRIVARFNAGFVSGFYQVGGMQLYVSNGTGLWNGFALRIGVPSELTVITLRRAAGG